MAGSEEHAGQTLYKLVGIPEPFLISDLMKLTGEVGVAPAELVREQVARFGRRVWRSDVLKRRDEEGDEEGAPPPGEPEAEDPPDPTPPSGFGPLYADALRELLDIMARRQGHEAFPADLLKQRGWTGCTTC